jgi:hypothetical protein
LIALIVSASPFVRYRASRYLSAIGARTGEMR